MEIGDAFLLRDHRIDDLLHIVISAPSLDAHKIVTVSLTSYDRVEHETHKDGSCILDSSDHPWITHKSSISYRDGKVADEELLDSLIAKGSLIPQQPVSDDVLTRILEGAERTDELPNKCCVVLVNQRLIQI